ncbi:MAG TPA: DUF4179 domain-containing protein [Phycisphaerae bacterium]|nr:DUF4179 domain-containing protein [Phycisphaerae bacterium]
MANEGNPQNKDIGANTDVNPTEETSKPVKKKRWLRRIVVAFVLLFFLLAGLVVASPFLASTSPVKNYASRWIGEQVGGDVSLSKLNLSWFSDCEVEGFSMTDAQGRQWINSGSVVVPGGVWGLLKRLDIPENIRIESPSIIVYVDEEAADDDTPGDAPDGDHGDADSGSSDFKLPTIKLTLRDGKVTIVGPPSHSDEADPVDYVIDAINADVTLVSSGKLAAKIDAHSPDGATLFVDADVEDALVLTRDLSDPALATNSAGSIKIHSDKPFDLQRLTEALPASYRASGEVLVKIDADIRDGVLTSNLDVQVADIQAAAIEGAKGLSSGRLGLTGTITVDQEKASGKLDLEGDAGLANAVFDWPYREAESMPPIGEHVEAMLAGKLLAWPNLAAKLSGNVDLAVLSKAFPGLLRLKSDVYLQDGLLDIHELALTGGDKPVAKLAASLHDVVAATPNGPIQWDPATVELDVTSSDAGDLDVRRALVDAGVVRIEGQGDLNGLSASVASDLDRLRDKISPVVDLGVDELAGRLNANIELNRSSDERVAIKCDVSGDQVRYRSGVNYFDAPKVDASTRCEAQLNDRKLVRISSDETKVDIGGEIVATVKGTVDVANDGFSLDVTLPQVQVARLNRLLQGFGVELKEIQSGSMSGVAHLERADANAVILTSGDLSARDIQIDTQSAPHRADLGWTNVRLDLLASNVVVESATLESAIAAVDVSQCELGYGDAFKLAGRIKGRADLQKCAKLLPSDEDGSQPFQNSAGHLTFDANCQTDGTRTAMNGTASIDDLAMQADDGTVYRDKLLADYNVNVDSAADTISLDKLKLTSNAASIDLGGKVASYSATQNADISGTFSLDWQRVMQVCYELYPATRELITIAGRNDSQLKVRGPLNNPNQSPAFRDASMSANLGWQSAEIMGIPLGKLELKPTLNGGKLSVPVTKVAAAGGNVQLGCDVMFGSQGPQLRLPSNLQMLSGIEVTPRLGEQLLSRFNPIFGNSTRMAGRLDLTIRELSLPLGDALYTGGSGLGRLDLHNFKITPSEFFVTLLELGGMGQPDMYAIDVSGVDFTVQNGRITYQDLTLNFAQQRFDLKFRGSVGFDDSVDLFVSVPVQEHLLRRLKVQGPVGEYATRLAGTRIEIPITGSRSNPKLDFSQVKMDALIKDVVADTLLNPQALMDAFGQAAGGGNEPANQRGGRTPTQGKTAAKGREGGAQTGRRASGKEKEEEKPGLGGLLGGVLKEKEGKDGKGKEAPKKDSPRVKKKEDDKKDPKDQKERERKSGGNKRRPTGRKRSSER